MDSLYTSDQVNVPNFFKNRLHWISAIFLKYGTIKLNKIWVHCNSAKFVQYRILFTVLCDSPLLPRVVQKQLCELVLGKPILT